MKKAYITKESLDEKRLKGLLALYDSALTACVEADAPALETALDVLQAKLNYAAWPGLGLVLYAQYNRCRELGRNGNYLEAGRVLATLRDAWSSGEKRKEVERRKSARIAGAMRAKEKFAAMGV